jgi:putative ABC transport system permease protein
VPVYEVKTANELVEASLARCRFATTLLTLFALLALILALVGLYGLTSYLAAERTSEIGIRMALGVQRTSVLRLLLTQGLRMASLGLLLGLFSCLLLRPVIASQLFGVGPADSLTLISVSVLFLGIATMATALPARRATRIDPMSALRCE